MNDQAEALAVSVAASLVVEEELDGRRNAPPNACPPRFVRHVFETDFSIDCPRERVWAWLEAPETFVDGQVWPFRVEFLSADPDTPAGFHVGGLNAHHGPLMSFCGQLTEIREGAYRSLDYFYGSYVLSLRLVRPTRLEFWVEDGEKESTRVRLRVSSFAHARFAKLWTRLQRLFWRRFPRWMSSALSAPLTDSTRRPK
jgi:hypothetical protein